MTTTITVSEARAALPAILDRVLAGEEVTLTRHGTPVAVVIRPDKLRTRRAAAALEEASKVADLLVDGRRRTLQHRPRLAEDRAEALLAQVRASRSNR